LNLRPSGYEPDELPGCSTPRYQMSEGAGRAGSDGWKRVVREGKGGARARLGSDIGPLSSGAELLARPGDDPLSHR
jgi:hypothetical protein